MVKECETCGREVFPIRETEVLDGLWVVVYRCPECCEYTSGEDYD